MIIHLVLAKLIASIHLVAVAILLFGWALPPRFLPIHLLCIGLTVIQWRLNNNQCLLTQLQNALEKGTSKKEEQEAEFTKALLKKVGIELTDQQLFVFIYSLMALSFLISLRYFVIWLREINYL